MIRLIKCICTYPLGIYIVQDKVPHCFWIVRAPQESEETVNPDDGGQGLSERREEYIDEDELLNMPNLLDEMARGMQVSPLRITSYSSDDSPGNSDGDNLWSYTL